MWTLQVQNRIVSLFLLNILFQVIKYLKNPLSQKNSILSLKKQGQESTNW